MEETSSIMASTGKYFGLLIRSDSMITKMFEKDVIIVRKQSDVHSDDVAVVFVNGYEILILKNIKIF